MLEAYQLPHGFVEMVNQLDDDERDNDLKWIIYNYKDNQILETIAEGGNMVLKDFSFLKDYKDCRIGRSLKNPLFIKKKIPRITVFVLIKNLTDILIFNEPFLDYLIPPAIFNNPVPGDKTYNFRKFCKDMYYKKGVKFVRERLWNNICK